MWRVLKKPAVYISLIVIIVGIFILKKNGDDSVLQTVTAEVGQITEEVSITGTVRPVGEAKLSFERAGQVGEVRVTSGTNVSAGTIIAMLANQDLRAALVEAEAGHTAAKAKLAELRHGPSPETLGVEEAKVIQAANLEQSAIRNLIDKLHAAYLKSDDGIRNQIDTFISNPTTNPQLAFSTAPQLKNEIEITRNTIESTLIAWRTIDQKITFTDHNYSLANVNIIRDYLDEIRTFLDNVAFAVNGLTPSSNIVQTTIDAYKANTLTARTSVLAAITDLSSAVEKHSSAETALRLAERQLSLVKAGNTAEEINAGVAAVEEARARILNANAQLEKTLIRAPFDGLIGRLNIKIGEVVTVGESIATILSGAEFEIETFIPEVDIANIALQNLARATLDAYSNSEEFEAVVKQIDIAETIIDGVSTYKVILKFTKVDSRIRSGLTADISIITNQKENVIVIPQRAVSRKNGSESVEILSAGQRSERQVKTGLRSPTGQLEIIEGLRVGEIIVLP